MVLSLAGYRWRSRDYRQNREYRKSTGSQGFRGLRGHQGSKHDLPVPEAGKIENYIPAGSIAI